MLSRCAASAISAHPVNVIDRTSARFGTLLDAMALIYTRRRGRKPMYFDFKHLARVGTYEPHALLPRKSLNAGTLEH